MVVLNHMNVKAFPLLVWSEWFFLQECYSFFSFSTHLRVLFAAWYLRCALKILLIFFLTYSGASHYGHLVFQILPKLLLWCSVDINITMTLYKSARGKQKSKNWERIFRHRSLLHEYSHNLENKQLGSLKQLWSHYLKWKIFCRTGIIQMVLFCISLLSFVCTGGGKELYDKKILYIHVNASWYPDKQA